MLCKKCGNTESFTMIKDIAIWSAEEKRFVPITDGCEYYMCDNCMTNNEAGGHIDTEGDY